MFNTSINRRYITLEYGYCVLVAPCIQALTIKGSEAWRLFPNPADMLLNLNGGDFAQVSWCITDLQGREVKVGAINQSEGGVIGIQDLQPGLFYFLLERNGNHKVRKFVKQ